MLAAAGKNLVQFYTSCKELEKENLKYFIKIPINTLIRCFYGTGQLLENIRNKTRQKL